MEKSKSAKRRFALNSYFIDHPEMILGRQTSESTQYGGQDFTVAPIEGLELADQLHDAVKYIGGQYTEAELPDLGEGEAIDTSIPADPDVKNHSYTVVDGGVYFRENSRMVKPELNATAIERVKGMVALRDCVNDLIDLQMNEYTPNAAIKEKQIQLNQLYDEFSAKYGLINDRGNRLAFSDDSSYYLLCSLEVLDDDGNLERKADMFTKRTIKQQRSVEHVDTASEALAVSIGERAEVDLPCLTATMNFKSYTQSGTRWWKTPRRSARSLTPTSLPLSPKRTRQNLSVFSRWITVCGKSPTGQFSSMAERTLICSCGASA